MKLVMTTHACYERADRMVALFDTLGFDEIVLETPDDKNDGATLCLMSTGVVIVKGKTDDRVITAFMVSIDRACAMYKVAGYNRIPQKMYNRIVMINKKYPHLRS